MRTNNIIKVVVAACVCLPVAFVAAQQPEPQLQTATKVQWVTLLIPVIVPIVIAVLKMLIPKIPKPWLPIIAPIVGALVDLVLSGSFGQNTVIGMIAGSAGVGLREIVDQIKKSAAAAKDEK